MIKLVFSNCKFFVFLLLLFAFNRSLFILFNPAHFEKFSFQVFFNLVSKPLPLDVSTACYLFAIPFLLVIVDQLFQIKQLSKIIFAFVLFELILVNLISAIDIVIYREMDVKIHFKLFNHLQHPTEVLRSLALKYWLEGISLIIVCTFLEFYSLRKIIGNWILPTKIKFWKNSLFAVCILLIGAFFIVLGVRGGLQQIPINESEVYFSKNNFFNNAAVNPCWTLIHSYIENKKVLAGNPYHQMDDATAKKIVADLYRVEKDSTISILKIAKPNVLFIILESWSADMIESLGGIKNVTPNFEKFIQQGILFKHCYASGTLSDQGIPAVLSAYPAQPITSIIANPEKYSSMHGINQNLKKLGYHTSFYFGGQLIYGNIKSYLYYLGFDEIKEQKDFADLPSGKLGIHDSLMLQTWLQHIHHFPTPFFSCLFTVSTHSPFDAPMPEVIHEGGYLMPYINSVHYADKSLADFFTVAKKEKWYANTLFVLVSDHSHDSPLNLNEEHSGQHFHIPLLFFGDAIKEEWRGKTIEKTCSQNDIIATVLHQLNQPSNEFNWSKNLFNPLTKDFAYSSFTEGGGFVTNSAEARWEKPSNQIITHGRNEKWNQQNAEKAKAFLQTLMNEYLKF